MLLVAHDRDHTEKLSLPVYQTVLTGPDVS